MQILYEIWTRERLKKKRKKQQLRTERMFKGDIRELLTAKVAKHGR
jgi:hypothetical protein